MAAKQPRNAAKGRASTGVRRSPAPRKGSAPRPKLEVTIPQDLPGPSRARNGGSARANGGHARGARATSDGGGGRVAGNGNGHLNEFDQRELLAVLVDVRAGDFSARLPSHWTGVPGKIADTFNAVVALNESMAAELERIATVVGKEGRVGERASLPGAGGAWSQTLACVNALIADLVQPNAEVARVIGAVAQGDLSQTMSMELDGRPLTGEFLQTARTVNTMVEQLGSFASEVTRVAREVGTEGKLGGQATVKGVSGTWKDLTDNVNHMANNLTSQVRNIADVTTAVAKGDLSKKITADARGEILQLKDTINTMVDQLSAFAGEVTRVAREVGTEGQLGGQATVQGVSGTWKDLTDNVNHMANNLTSQVRNIADVTTAVAKGDLSKKITADARGEILELKDTINTMVDQLNAFAGEVTRVAREVGTEGTLGVQASVPGVSGTWKDLTDNVNAMAGNLTVQLRDVSKVATAIASGDLGQKITAQARGEILQIKDVINTMVDQLNSFAGEVTRVARDVGTEGRLGGQAVVPGVSGTWKDLTDNVNQMANNLTTQVRNIAEVTTAVAGGDLSRKITVPVRGELAELKDTINTMVDRLNAFAGEVTRVAREVGTEGRLGGQATVQGVSGTWKDLTDSVNQMANNLTIQVRNIAEVTTAVAGGDLSRKITVDLRGELAELKETINTMVDRLNAFAGEVTRVAREVGTEGKLGGQAGVPGVAGVWKDLTENVNSMAMNLTDQVRGIARVVTAVANGNLKQKLMLEAKGEIAELADTINAMTDTLATFADQVTTVAREVGEKGNLGGQANVPGASGTWRDLTDNVNRLAATLTTQIRAIAEVATAVTKGDLSRSIAVEAAGEVASLKDNLNEMIRNLAETTRTNTEQDWLKTNLTRFTRMLQGQRDLLAVAKLILSELAPLVNAQQGIFYLNEAQDGHEADLKLLASYAHRERKQLNARIREGEGLVGQVAFEKERILLTEVPDDYVKIGSGLGESRPRNIVVLPVVFENQVKAVVELASFQRFNETHLSFLDQLVESVGIVLNTLAANSRTEELLKQSQSLTTELQNQQRELQDTNQRLEQQARSLTESERLLKEQQEELQQTNEELEEKARLLSEQNREVEQKNSQIELARRELEEKAEQLALTSRYKSEFLANMSHELRTPLNSLLILSKMLSENAEGNLTEKQVKYADTIHQAGADLLDLINEILDLAKIESGTMEVDVRRVTLSDIRDHVERNFRPLAEDKGLTFEVQLDPKLPDAISTDAQRLQQVLRNLLANAVKFTDSGGITLKVAPATSGWRRGNDALDKAEQVIAFAVRDTGIGIPSDKHRIIFEAFQQLDGTSTRRHGGTGLGLSISREIAGLLHGEIKVESEPGKGSTFTFFLPARRRNDVAPQPVSRAGGGSGSGGVRGLTAPAAQVRRARRPAGGPTTNATEDAEPDLTLPPEIADDRDDIAETDRVVLIIEDDVPFANILLDQAREKGFKGVVALQGEAGLRLARDLKPDAITLDLELPLMDGWAVLDRLKHDPASRHIPVHIISARGDKQRGLRQGALEYLEKPVTKDALDSAFADIHSFLERRVKRLLVVEDDDTQRASIVDLVGDKDIEVVEAKTGTDALAAIKAQPFDCCVLDLGLTDMSGFELIESIRRELGPAELPIVVYTGRELTKAEESELRHLADAVIVKDVKSPERLLDETALFLHRVQSELPPEKRRMLEQVHLSDPVLAEKTVLIVDDDMRNVFALTSVLERHRMKVIYAESGREAIDRLQQSPGVDVVLMDIMLPEMDGYETMRAIRGLSQFRGLPIIALTAKAMKGDREKCIEAGASDYVAKPVDTEQLLSLLRVWLYK